ncbi:MAG: isocitrate lyase/phosphoenolpyruvate mutase family protein [Cocleimonas sp.]
MQNKAEIFQNLHLDPNTFIMANAWSAGSAILLEESGFQAIATTSAGIAYNNGLPDYESAVPLELALQETRKIAHAVKIPVSMDAENGYGDSAESVAKNIKKIAVTGVVGANIEDYTGKKDNPLYDAQLAKERIQAAKEAVADLDYPFILTGRSDCFLIDHPEALKESIYRANLFREAGADCLFIPGVKDIETIKTLVQEIDGPISVVMGLSGAPISLAELNQAGVSRISIGGSLARATFGLIRNASKEMLEKGTFEFSKLQIADDELCNLFARRNDK